MSGDAVHRAPLWWVARWCGRALTYLALAVLALSAGAGGQPYGWAAATPVQASVLPAPATGVTATVPREATADPGVSPTREATPVHRCQATGGTSDRPLSVPVGRVGAGPTAAHAAVPAPPRAPPRPATGARPPAG